MAGRQQVRSLLRSLRDEGCCVVLTTHELEEAERLADSVVIVDGGRLVATGHPGELSRALPSEEIRFGAPPGLDVAGLGATLGALVREDGPGEYVVACRPDAGGGRRADRLAGHPRHPPGRPAGRAAAGWRTSSWRSPAAAGPPPVAPTPPRPRRSRRRGRNPA